MNRKKVIFNVALAAAAFLFYLYRVYGEKEKELQIMGETMGTTYHIVLIVSKNEPEFYKKAVDERLEKINQILSTYIEDSEISLFNKNGDLLPISASKEFYAVLRESLRIAEESEGYYDPTLMPLVDLWGFGPEKHPKTWSVSKKAVNSVLKRVGYRKLVLTNDGKIVKKEPTITLDLSSIAKGYGVDLIAELLDSLGVKRYLVEIGGEVKVKGENKGNMAWNIGVKDPVRPGDIYKIVQLKDLSLATSGTYFNLNEINHRKYSHIIDPHTGYPVQHKTLSVSVIHKENMTADGYATAFLCAGYPKGFEMAKRLNLNALFITVEADGSLKEYQTEGFKKFIVKAP